MSFDKRRFEMVEGSSSKFWEITVEGASLTVTYGRIGTAGTSKTTKTDSAEEAAAEAAKLIREKTKKGYQELGATTETYRTPAHIGTSEHVDRFMNYKVVLFNPEADPEGGESGMRELPALRDLDKLVYAVRVGYDDGEEAFGERFTALLADPKIGELRGLLIGNWFAEVCEAPPSDAYRRLILNAAKLRSLEGLFLGDVIQEETEISWLHQDNLAPLLHALPKLQQLIVRGGEGLRFTKLKHEGLISLTVQTGGLSSEAVRDLAAAELPNLRRLTLWLGCENYGGDSTIEDLAPLLSGKRLPKLEHLGLQDSEHADEVAAAVATSPILARLKGLDLSMGTLSDEGAEALLASPHIRGLKHLNLRHHYLSTGMMTKLRALGIEIDLSDRQEGEEEDDRYIEVSE